MRHAPKHVSFALLTFPTSPMQIIRTSEQIAVALLEHFMDAISLGARAGGYGRDVAFVTPRHAQGYLGCTPAVQVERSNKEEVPLLGTKQRQAQ